MLSRWLSEYLLAIMTFSSGQPSRPTPFTFVCDEAHLYLPSDNVSVREQRALDSFNA